MVDALASMTVGHRLAIAVVALLVLGTIVLCLITILGAPTDEDAADEMQELMRKQAAREDAMITLIELRLPRLRAELNKMRVSHPGHAHAEERVRVRIQIYDDERMLEYLRRRKAPPDPDDQRQNTARIVGSLR